MGADAARGTAWRDAPALTVAMLFPFGMALLYFVVLAGPAGAAEANRAVVAAYTAGKVVMLALPLAYVGWFEPGRLRPRRPTADGLALGVGFGLLVGAATLGLFFGVLQYSPLLGRTPALLYDRVAQFGLTTPAAFLAMAAFLSVVHSLFEEYYWRWFVFGTLRRHLPVGPAAGLSGLAFALHHGVVLAAYFPDRFWTLGLLFTAGVGVGGAVWAWLYDRSGSLVAPWVSHLLIDAAIMAVGYAMLGPFWP